MAKRKKRSARRAAVIELPTAQSKRHGKFIHERVDRDGPKVARNICVVPLVDCFERGQITWGMYNAGLQFERLVIQFRAMIDAPTAGRDSCDFSVRGNTNETTVERALRIKDEYVGAVSELEPNERSILQAILVMHEKTGDRRDKYKRWSAFVSGLKSLQKHWKIAENEKQAC